MDNKILYFDHAATTPIKQEVLEEMIPFFKDHFGNASSVHFMGRGARKAVEASRERIADSIGCTDREIFFTAGGTESDNWAILGTALKEDKGKHIITTAVEHPAVLNTCQYLEAKGFDVTYLPVDEYGAVSIDDLNKAIRKDTILISIMLANNEVGTIQPIEEAGKIAKEKDIIFHTDAVQAVGSVSIDIKKLNVDMLTLSAHKFYGPKGVGALYIRKGLGILPFTMGGNQERKKRAGTENVPGIVGMGKAIEIAVRDMEKNRQHLTVLREQAIQQILETISNVKINGHPHKILPGILNLSFESVKGEAILLMLDRLGIAASSGSACASGSLDPSHVLLAMNCPHELAQASVRFSFGVDNSTEDIRCLANNLKTIIEKLRAMAQKP
ncbi:MAG: cysteine desulfurase NifS [Clostridiales bacterium]|nr:cysteine desulfurase NifS [Clostridiales bacterium]